jgi:hypothetical protein
MKFRALPQATANQIEINRSVKENLEALVGLRSNRILPLTDTATTAEIISKVNELVARLSA